MRTKYESNVDKYPHMDGAETRTRINTQTNSHEYDIHVEGNRILSCPLRTRKDHNNNPFQQSTSINGRLSL